MENKDCVCLLKKSEGVLYEDAICEIHDSSCNEFTAQINFDIDGELKEMRGWLYLTKKNGEEIFDFATNGIDIKYCPFCGREL